MISMSQVHSIRQMRKEGESIASIARKTGVSRTTVYEKLKEQDLSPRMPMTRSNGKMLDAYRSVIEEWLDEDGRNWRKQRHTARRIYQRLRDELGVQCSESTVRHYVHDLKLERRSFDESYLDLVWAPAEAQADFGEADFLIFDQKKRLSYFVLSFPFSNMGFAQVFPSENSECVCQALKQIFEYIGGVPVRIVFDNATGVGRRICDKVRTTDTFSAFAAHYGFDFSFCNPNSGHEKGNVEGKVKYIRTNLFVPVPKLWNLSSYNKRLLDKCTELAKKHYLKGEGEDQLFMEDRLAMMGLPEHAFEVVKYVRCKADKKGKVQLDGRHFYSTDPALARRSLIAGLGATTITIYTEDGTEVCRHERQYGSAPTDTTNPASQLPLLSVKAGGWRNSEVRANIPDDLRDYMDKLERQDLGRSLKLMRRQVEDHGWDVALLAMEEALALTGRIDEASVSVAAARAEGGSIAYDDPVDLSVYDVAICKEVQNGRSI